MAASRPVTATASAAAPKAAAIAVSYGVCTLTRVATDPSNPFSRSVAASRAERASLLVSPTRSASTRAESAARS